jgi:ribosomal protein L9
MTGLSERAITKSMDGTHSTPNPKKGPAYRNIRQFFNEIEEKSVSSKQEEDCTKEEEEARTAFKSAEEELSTVFKSVQSLSITDRRNTENLKVEKDAIENDFAAKTKVDVEVPGSASFKKTPA